MSENEQPRWTLTRVLEIILFSAAGGFVGMTIGASAGRAQRGCVVGAALGAGAGLFGAKKIKE